jgi:hypothetical protein
MASHSHIAPILLGSPVGSGLGDQSHRDGSSGGIDRFDGTKGRVVSTFGSEEQAGMPLITGHDTEGEGMVSQTSGDDGAQGGFDTQTHDAILGNRTKGPASFDTDHDRLSERPSNNIQHGGSEPTTHASPITDFRPPKPTTIIPNFRPSSPTSSTSSSSLPATPNGDNQMEVIYEPTTIGSISTATIYDRTRPLTLSHHIGGEEAIGVVVTEKEMEDMKLLKKHEKELERERKKIRNRLVEGLDNEDLNAMLRSFDKVSQAAFRWVGWKCSCRESLEVWEIKLLRTSGRIVRKAEACRGGSRRLWVRGTEEVAAIREPWHDYGQPGTSARHPFDYAHCSAMRL